MLVYGKNSCEEILKQEKNIKRVYLERNFKDRVITDLIEKLKIKPIFLTKYELDDLCEGNHQGIVIEALEYEYADIDEKERLRRPLRGRSMPLLTLWRNPIFRQTNASL